MNVDVCVCVWVFDCGISFVFTIGIEVPTAKTLHPDNFADAPLCVTDKVVIVGAFRNENLNIYCEVQADPPPRYCILYSNTQCSIFILSEILVSKPHRKANAQTIRKC